MRLLRYCSSFTSIAWNGKVVEGLRMFFADAAKFASGADRPMPDILTREPIAAQKNRSVLPLSTYRTVPHL